MTAPTAIGHNFISTWQPPPDTLRARFYELENQFFHHRILDPEAWRALADDFERSNRPHSAESTRHSLTTFQQIQEEEAKVGVGKACLPHKNYP